MPADLPKTEFFRRLGFGGDTARYEQILYEAGLTHPGKQRIATTKQEEVAEVLRRTFIPLCQRDECQLLAKSRAPGRAPAPAASPGDCEICAGSINALAVAEMVRACETVGWRRLCIVGGSPNTTAQLSQLVGQSLQLRVVEGTTSRSKRDAESDLGWADRVVIWGSTELAHKVSALYKGPHVITAARRGVAELAKAVTESASRVR